MNNDVKIEIIEDDKYDKTYKNGEKGYVVGFIRGAIKALAVVVIEERLVTVPFNHLKVLK